jgi:BioD-like phosphotransacetylase family protein
MSRLVLLSPTPGSGKTTVALLLASRLGTASLSRLGEDANAAGDAALFAQVERRGEVELAEAPAGDASVADSWPAIVVADPTEQAANLADFCRSVGDRLVGAILNRVPARRRDRIVNELQTKGVEVLFALPEDRILAAPSLDDVAGALNATAVFFDSDGKMLLDGAVIASISADPGQGYFVHRKAGSVIVRSDKPDLQLAALNAGATCLIVTGGLPLLGYVKERAAGDEIPLIRTDMETGDAVKSIESLYASGPFSGSSAKLSRLEELTRDFDASKLLRA